MYDGYLIFDDGMTMLKINADTREVVIVRDNAVIPIVLSNIAMLALKNYLNK